MKVCSISKAIFLILFFALFGCNSCEKKQKPSSEKSTQQFNGFSIEGLSVSQDELKGGGPTKDGIPPIDNPLFILGSEYKSKYGSANDQGILVGRGARQKLYPFSILNWHEVINDTIDSEPIVISLCPLVGVYGDYKTSDKIIFPIRTEDHSLHPKKLVTYVKKDSEKGQLLLNGTNRDCAVLNHNTHCLRGYWFALKTFYPTAELNSK